MSENLVVIENLKKHFPIYGGVFSSVISTVKAVDGISFSIKKGETVGLVGESGCGKTTAGRSIIKLIEPTEGKIIFDGQDISKLNNNELREIRKKMQIIFQDPYSSLNPRKTVLNIIGEAMVYHKLATKDNVAAKVAEILEKVGLSKFYINRYPHEFSGGQRQRIGIARAIALKPSFIVCDEPVSALDVSIQAQVINLLEKLREEMNFSYLFIAHDLAVVKHISNRVIVMYLGRIVEDAKTDELFKNTKHPYTKALLSAIPIADPENNKERIILKGDVPTPIDPPSGCHFHNRCPIAKEICKKERPPEKFVSDDHRYVCHF